MRLSFSQNSVAIPCYLFSCFALFNLSNFLYKFVLKSVICIVNYTWGETLAVLVAYLYEEQ